KDCPEGEGRRGCRNELSADVGLCTLLVDSSGPSHLHSRPRYWHGRPASSQKPCRQKTILSGRSQVQYRFLFLRDQFFRTGLRRQRWLCPDCPCKQVAVSWGQKY